jgi:hypothetical protein
VKSVATVAPDFASIWCTVAPVSSARSIASPRVSRLCASRAVRPAQSVTKSVNARRSFTRSSLQLGELSDVQRLETDVHGLTLE